MRRPFIIGIRKVHKIIEEGVSLIDGSSLRACDFLEIGKQGPAARENQ